MRAEFKQRLAESFETALRHGDGRAIAVEMDTGARAPVLGEVRLPDLQLLAAGARAAALLVQQPDGRLPALRRPRRRSTFFDPKRVVAFPQLSLASGAIKGWDRRNQFYFQMLQSLAKHYGFDVEQPFEKLPERVQNIVLYGSGDEKIPFTYLTERGRPIDARARVRRHRPEPRAPLSRDRLA